MLVPQGTPDHSTHHEWSDGPSIHDSHPSRSYSQHVDSEGAILS